MTRYLLDTTTLIGFLRGDEDVVRFVTARMDAGHDLCTTSVNVAEVVMGLRPTERKATEHFLDRLQFLETPREAAVAAGRYVSEFQRRGQALAFSDALVAATAKRHGAVLVTDSPRDFPMRDVRVERPRRP